MAENNIFKRGLVLASSLGSTIFRNNVGYFKTLDGKRTVFCGLCKDSSDGIGLTPTVVTQEMVGKTIAIFTALEAKDVGGRLTTGQSNFINFVKKSGGIAGVFYNDDDLRKILQLPVGV